MGSKKKAPSRKKKTTARKSTKKKKLSKKREEKPKTVRAARESRGETVEPLVRKTKAKARRRPVTRRTAPTPEPIVESYDEEEEDPGFFANPFGEFGDDEETVEDPHSELGFDNVHEADEGNLGDGFDIFKYGMEVLTKQGDYPRFAIYKNGSYIAQKGWPYSWDKLLSEYGSGLYRIQVKRASSGTFVKQCTQMVGDPEDEFKPKTETTTQPQQPSMGDVTKYMMDFFGKTMTMAQQQALHNTQSQTKSSASETTAITNLIIESNRTQSEMMMKTQENTNRIMERMQENTNKMFEKMDAKFEKMHDQTLRIIESMGDNDDGGPTQMELFKMMQEQEALGESKAMKFYEMVEEFAERKAEREGSQHKSTFDKMSDMLLPVLAHAAKASGGTGQAPTPQPTQAQLQAERTRQFQEQQKERYLKEEADKIEAHKLQNTQGQRVVQQTQPGATVKYPLGNLDFNNKEGVQTMPRKIEDAGEWNQNKKRQGEEWEQNKRRKGEEWGPNTVKGEADAWEDPRKTGQVPTDSDWGEDSTKVVPDEEWGERQGQSANGERTLRQKPENLKEVIRAKAVPIITDELSKQNPAWNAADLVLDELRGESITAHDVLENFTLEDMLSVAKGNPQTAPFITLIEPWLKDFYEHIQARTVNDVRPTRSEAVQTQ